MPVVLCHYLCVVLRAANRAPLESPWGGVVMITRAGPAHNRAASCVTYAVFPCLSPSASGV